MLGSAASTQDQLNPLIDQIGAKYGIDPNQIRAHIQVESGWNILAKRYEPALNDASIGLMQLLLNTARWITGNQALTEQDLYKPEINIDAGAHYLSYLYGKFNGNAKDVISAYNAGHPLVAQAGGYVNQGYVDKVWNNWMIYAKLGSGSAGEAASEAYTAISGGSQANSGDSSTLLLLAAGILVMDTIGVFRGRRR